MSSCSSHQAGKRLRRNIRYLSDCNCTFEVQAANDAQTALGVNTSCGKDHIQQNLSKLILWCRNLYLR